VSRHILVVDADALLRRSLVFNLEKAGYRASTAVTAENAIRQARLDPPDLVLLDADLPGLGSDALRDMRQRIDAPVIFLTTRCRELRQELVVPGVDDYITMPFDIDGLLASIEAVLRRAAPPSPPARERAPAGER
jgi:DNA-binding response OmpR family regulator